MHNSTARVSDYEPLSEVETALRLIAVEAATRLIHWSIKEGEDGARLSQFDDALEKAWTRFLEKKLSTDSARITRSDFLLKQLYDLSDKSNHARNLVRVIYADNRDSCLGPMDREQLLRTWLLRS